MKILIPTDFSENSLKSIEYAVSVWGLKNVKYHLLHTFEIVSNSASLSFGNLKSKMEKSADENLVRFYNQIINKYPTIQLSVEHKYGALADVINRIPKSEFDLIVMGTKGTSGIKEVFLGSNCWDVIENTLLPVLAIPLDVELANNKSFLFTVDPENLPSLKVLETFQQILRNTSYDTEILIVKNEVNIDEKNVRELFKNITNSLTIVSGDDVVKQIEDFANKHPLDIVTVLNKKKSFLEKLFHQSITKKLTFHTKSPLLALKD